MKYITYPIKLFMFLRKSGMVGEKGETTVKSKTAEKFNSKHEKKTF